MNKHQSFKKYLSSLISHLSSPRGFTLVELLVVLSVISILSVVGVAAFVDFSRRESVNSGVNELVSVLQTAKSRAQSQVKPTGGVCQTSALEGYRVTIDTANTYHIDAVCTAGIDLVEEKTLPTNITLGLEGSVFFFRALSGGVNPGTVTVIGYGQTRCVNVSDTSVISTSTQPGSCPTFEQ